MHQWFCSVSNLSQTLFDGPQCCKDASQTYSSLTKYLCFDPLWHLAKFGHGVFLHPEYFMYVFFYLYPIDHYKNDNGLVKRLQLSNNTLHLKDITCILT
jgi:hypothetical protein